MIAWLLLLSLLSKSTQDQQGEENGVSHCEPQNLNLTSSDQMLMLTWEDDPLCSRGVLIYEFVVLIADKAVHSEEVAVEPAQIRSRHSWNWTSHLPLECAFHSVRLRSQYGNYTSQWKEERIRKQSGGFRVFPRNKVLEVGTNATFCCIVSPNEEFYFMNLGKYRGTNNITTKISEDVYALTLHLSQPPSHTSTDVYCNIKGQGHNGASNFIGYPPRAYDLQCETRDLKSVECMWKEKKTYLTNKHPTTYWLGGRKCQPVVYSCSQPFAGEKNWTLTAENVLGKVELQDRADLKERVHMFAPEELTALTVNARNVSLKWKWTEKHYSSLNITCLINVSDGETHNIRSISGAGLNAAPINNLTPNWRHSVKVQCGTAQHFWKWGDWSKTLEIHTKADVPDALDVWMMMKEDHTVVIWKEPRANQSHGHIIDYEVTWSKTRERNNDSKVTLSNSSHSFAHTVDHSEEYIVSVTARNSIGSSPPSTIIIPSSGSGETKVNISRISGSNGGFNLSWTASPKASCGYIIEWCPVVACETVDWRKVPFNVTNARIFLKDFKDGLRYSLSIYACTRGAPVLLETREGYIRETRITVKLSGLKYKQQDSDIEVSWDPIPLKDQTAFIQGFVLSYWTNMNRYFTVKTNNSEATNLTARNLDISTYTFMVTAQTIVGQCANNTISVTMNSSTDRLLILVFISMGTVFTALSLITILCYRHWACIKEKVYPPIPKPVLPLSPTERVLCPLPLDENPHSEEDITVIPELLYIYNKEAPAHVSQDYLPFGTTQTSSGFYNKPPSLLNLPTEPSSMFRGVFPNPSYNLVFQSGEQQSESSSSGYLLQSPADSIEELPDSPMSCLFTYIMLPQTH